MDGDRFELRCGVFAFRDVAQGEIPLSWCFSALRRAGGKQVLPDAVAGLGDPGDLGFV